MEFLVVSASASPPHLQPLVFFLHLFPSFKHLQLFFHFPKLQRTRQPPFLGTPTRSPLDPQTRYTDFLILPCVPVRQHREFPRHFSRNPDPHRNERSPKGNSFPKGEPLFSRAAGKHTQTTARTTSWRVGGSRVNHVTVRLADLSINRHPEGCQNKGSGERKK